MKCSDYHDLWQRRLDGQVLGTSPDALEHLRGCPACSALERGAASLGPALRRLSPPALPPVLNERIVQAVLRDRRKRLDRQRWGRLASLATAACILLALGVALARRSPPARPSPALARAATKPTAVPPAAVDESVQEMGSVVASVTTRTADATVAQTRLLLPSMSTPDLGEMTVTTSLQPSAQSLREAGENISAGLAPVRQSARRAVELFLRELPVDEDKPSGL